MNTCVNRIARRQARLGGFVESPSPPLEASKHSCQIVNRIVNRFFIFMYHVSYRIVYRKIHKHYIKFIKHYTYTYIYYKIETYANNDYFNYHLC